MISKIKQKITTLRADAHMREAIRSAAIALFIRVIGMVLGFAISVVIARLLGAEGSGVYYLATSVMVIAATISQLGFENTVVKFVAAHASIGEWKTVRFVGWTSIKVVGVASLIIAVMLFFGAKWLSTHLFNKSELETPIQLIAIALIPFTFSQIQAEILRGLKQITESQIVRSVLLPLVSLIVIYPLVMLANANGSLMAYIFACILTSMAAWYFWEKAFSKLQRGESRGNSSITSRDLFNSGIPLFGVTLAGIVIQQAATVFLGVWCSTEDVGIFNVANRVAALLLFPLMAMTSVLAPKFAAMHKQGEVNELEKLVRRSSAILTAIAVPAVIGVYFSAELILGFFGSDFVDGIWTLRLLLVGVLINASTGALGELLVMTGNEKLARNLNVDGAISLLMLCFILIPSYGQLGAAIAVSASYTMLNLTMVFFVKKRLGFWPVPIAKIHH